jgi:ABC-type phosphate/phosphonate transport system substrate-binding protein
MVQQTFTHAAATASNAVVKKWEEGGGKVLGRSKAVPIKHVLAGPGINAAQLERLRAYFVALDSTEDGRKKLEAIKVTGYAPFDTNELLALGTWLGL